MAQATRVFRVFVSSTFADFTLERNALQRDVFPRLEAHCAERGFQFQAIDLRWGVGAEASLDQRTMLVCLGELERCQDVSPRPNFIVLLGDRYGWLPLPAEIPEDELSAIALEIDDETTLGLLDHWYEADENAVPPIRRLRRRHDRFEDEKTWREEVETPLHRALAAAAGGLDLDPVRLARYVASATEQEILAGALEAPGAAEHVFCFLRTIEPRPEPAQARDYTDVGADDSLDEDAGRHLETLRQRLRQTLGDNVFDYAARWTGAGVGDDHVEKLCNDVLRSLTFVVDAQIDTLEKVPRPRQEIDAHEAFARDRAAVFVGRAAMRARIATYLAGDDPHPLGIFGEGGSGKSALVAKAMQEARETAAGATVIARFIGATPDSSDGRSLLEYLCRQLAEVAGDREEIPTAYEDLVTALPGCLERAAADARLIVFLDSLDQLSPANNAGNLTWLPRELPAGVRLVVTTRPGEPLVALRRSLPEESVVELGDMTAEEGAEMLDALLENAARTLVPEQRRIVLAGFAGCPKPLYLKLAFEEARLWSSSSEPSALGADERSIIEALYDRLAREHGELLVGRTLAYLAAGRDTSGLAEAELLDALSRDEAVFEEFRERARHDPPEARLPVVVWSRLFFDLQPFLSTKTSENTMLIAFFHRELGEVAEERYLAPDAVGRHGLLADIFREKADPEGDRSWAGTARALAELPYHLTQAARWDGVFDLLTDFSFLEKKAVKVGVVEHHDADGAPATTYTGALALLADYDRALAVFPAE